MAENTQNSLIADGLCVGHEAPRKGPLGNLLIIASRLVSTLDIVSVALVALSAFDDGRSQNHAANKCPCSCAAMPPTALAAVIRTPTVRIILASITGIISIIILTPAASYRRRCYR